MCDFVEHKYVVDVVDDFEMERGPEIILVDSV